MKANDLNNLRADLIGELEAINQYQEHLDQTEDEKLKELWHHIIADEKEHVAEIVKLLREIDPVQEEKFKKEDL